MNLYLGQVIALIDNIKYYNVQTLIFSLNDNLAYNVFPLYTTKIFLVFSTMDL